MTYDETYFEYSVRKGTQRQHPMAYLARIYLEAQHMPLQASQVYDANKIAKGLGKLYREAGSQEEAARRIKMAGEYFDQKGLDWVAETAWRLWEKIAQWDKDGRPEKRDFKPKKDNSLLYD